MNERMNYFEQKQRETDTRLKLDFDKTHKIMKCKKTCCKIKTRYLHREDCKTCRS